MSQTLTAAVKAIQARRMAKAWTWVQLAAEVTEFTKSVGIARVMSDRTLRFVCQNPGTPHRETTISMILKYADFIADESAKPPRKSRAQPPPASRRATA